ncbi:MAG: Bug family tripartite tricarboxylate transporter substrate binding protein [Betaproteobacteria bacterium]|jgi:tripartite-type tricarboxylate transporter receptor subunit TctC
MMIRQLVVLGLLFVSGVGTAQEWPARPVRVIVGYAPGGGHDFAARLVASRLADALKQPFVVENRPGASGTIATELVSKSAPDGTTLLVASPAETVVGGFAGLRMNYDWEKDLAPVTIIGETPLAVAVHPSVPVQTIEQLLDFARNNPGKLSYGTPGSGSSMHFAGESMKAISNIFIVHIGYRGAGPAMVDLLGGQVNMAIVGMPPVMGPHKSGKVKIVAVTSEKRSAATPDIPAMAELPGYQGYHFTNWQGIFVAAKTPQPLVERIAAEIIKVVREPDIRNRLLGAGVDPLGLSTAEFAKFLEREKQTYSQIAKTRNIKADD